MFDENDNPKGELGKRFQSYLGTQARTIPIDIPSWKQVPKEMKDKIWETILVKFPNSVCQIVSLITYLIS